MRRRAIGCLVVLAVLVGNCLFGPAGLVGGSLAEAAPPLPYCPPRPLDPHVKWPPPWCRLPKGEPKRSIQNLLLRLDVASAGAVKASSVLVYRLAIYNTGSKSVESATFRFPFDAQLAELVDVSMSNPTAWVSAIQDQGVEMTVEPLRSEQTVTATLRLRVRPGVRSGVSLAVRAEIDPNGRPPGVPIVSNRVAVVIGQPVSAAPDALTIVGDRSNMSGLTLSYAGFAANEHVSLWYERAGEPAVPIGDHRVDLKGMFTYQLVALNFSPGIYHIIGHGQFSNVTVASQLTFP